MSSNVNRKLGSATIAWRDMEAESLAPAAGIVLLTLAMLAVVAFPLF